MKEQKLEEIKKAIGPMNHEFRTETRDSLALMAHVSAFNPSIWSHVIETANHITQSLVRNGLFGPQALQEMSSPDYFSLDEIQLDGGRVPWVRSWNLRECFHRFIEKFHSNPRPKLEHSKVMVSSTAHFSII